MRPFALAALLVLLTALPAAAQERPILPQVVPKPTGKNGYEELVRAIDALRASKLLSKAETREGDGGTLAYRRAVLQEKPVADALRLIRQGLGKPVFSPRAEVGPRTLFPEFSGFRRLSRLLMIQQSVLLADGRTREALDVTRQGLRLGNAIQTDTLISGLVGIAVNAIAVAPLGRHLDQLSARDCEALFLLCREWLQQPDPTLRIMEGERRFALKAMEEMQAEIRKNGPAALKDFIGEDEEDEASRKEAQRLKADLPKTMAELERMQREVAARMDQHYAALFVELRKPFWQRRPLAENDDGTLAGRLISMLAPVFHQAGVAYARDQSRMRLLACHAAVLRYRWEHDRLPAALAELDLGELATDPFTGQPVRYEVSGPQRYRLYSAGPETGAEDEKAVDGRRPFSVVPGEF